MVIAAEQYAARMVLPASQRTYRQHWGSHNDLAAKALKKLAGPHLPASLKQLERAVATANKHADDAHRSKRDSPSSPAGAAAPDQNDRGNGELVDEDLDDIEREDADELEDAGGEV